jgi:hypothetical protein
MRLKRTQSILKDGPNYKAGNRGVSDPDLEGYGSSKKIHGEQPKCISGWTQANAHRFGSVE